MSLPDDERVPVPIPEDDGPGFGRGRGPRIGQAGPRTPNFPARAVTLNNHDQKQMNPHMSYK